MISFPRAMARSFQQTLRKSGLLSRSLATGMPFVRLTADAEGLTLQSSNPQLSVTLTLPLASEPDTFAVPAQLLADCSDGRIGEVSLTRAEHQILARWTERGIPHERDYLPIDLQKLPPVPPLPTEWAENPPAFLEALRQAMRSTDPDSSRYALGCLQLDGGAGCLRATDGRQALVQSGFRFPWTETLLIPGSKLFEAAALPRDAVVQIGRTTDHVVLRIGAWTLAFTIQTSGRFPEIERIIPADAAITTRLTLDPADATFLSERLDQLPRDDDPHHAVTVDLNGAVAIRARRSATATPTELVLRRSQRTGAEIRLATDRRYLQRALELGFRDIGFISSEKPALCRDAARQFLWMMLNSESTVPPTDDAVLIDSLQETPPRAIGQLTDAVTPVSIRGSAPRRRSKPPTTSFPTLPSTPRIAMTKPLPPKETLPTEGELIAQLLELRLQLRSAEQALVAIARQLRARRKQQQLVKSTLASLKQLQTLGV